jgi:hypothetical protein
MKKLSLEMLRLTSDEVIERSQMKKITGGYGGGVGCSMWSCNTGFGCYQSNCYCYVESGVGTKGVCVSRI